MQLAPVSQQILEPAIVFILQELSNALIFKCRLTRTVVEKGDANLYQVDTYASYFLVA